MLPYLWLAVKVPSRLCKKLEGAVFPFQVESLEDGVDDAVHAVHVDEADHGPGSSAYFHETTFNDIGGAHLLPQVPGQSEERQQFGQIALQSPHHGPVLPQPAGAEAAKRGLRLSLAVSPINRLRTPLHLVVVAFAYVL